MWWFKLNPMNIFIEFLIYLSIDNITKFLVISNRKQNRFYILLYECIFLGFMIGFISLYYYIPYVLICFLLIHILGTLYSEKDLKKLIELIHLFRLNQTTSKKKSTKKIPKEYLYNFHLKPTNDLRLQQVR